MFFNENFTIQTNMDKYPHSILVEEGSFRAQLYGNNLFQKLGKAVQSYLPAGKIKAVVTGVQEMILFGDTSIASHKAFELILNALHNAGAKLLQSERYRLKDSTINRQDLLKFKIKGEINSFQLHITSDFFDYPEELPILRLIAIWFKEWLEWLGFEENIADELKRKLPDYFFKELIKEWGKKRKYYESIEKHFESPFAKAWERKYYKNKYQDELRELIHEPAMGDKELPLSKIYIKPYFSLHKECLDVNRTHYENVYRSDGFIGDLNFKENLHNYIEQRIIYKKKPLGVSAENHNFIFVLGQPGQGKSSFCLYTINQLLEHKDFGQNIYFIRLKDLQHKDELIQHPFNVIEDYLKRKHELEFITKNAVLILDGLDELFMVNGLSNSDLEKFYRNLGEETKYTSNLSIILTSRYNYLNLSVINKKNTTILKINGLNIREQKDWLLIYKAVHSNCILTQEKLEEIDKNENLIHIKELIRQPILLHIVADANTDLNNQDTRSTIYKNLFDALLRRGWATKDGQLEKYHSLGKEEYAQEFREWLQEIAFTIYSSNFEYIQRKDLEILNGTKNMHRIIDTSSDIKDALKDLLVAFYFKNVNKNEEDEIKEENKNEKYALEFLHKSLQEYLAAEYIWRVIKDKLLAPHDKKWKFDIDDFKQALSLFFRLFSNKILNDSIRMLLIEMIEQDSNIKDKKALRIQLKQFFPSCLKYHFLDTVGIAEHSEIDTPPLDKAFNTFRGYWLILSHLGKTQNEDLLLNTFDSEQTILCDLINKGGGYSMNLTMTNLSLANLNRADLIRADLTQANMAKAELRQADLTQADLTEADLRYADLRQADLTEADLAGADLSHADLSQADLTGTDLSHAKMKKSYLKQANLAKAEMSEAELNEANLAYAILTEANLDGAYLVNADLIQVDLKQACLTGVSFVEANLTGANLTGANLTGANLTGANLSEANLMQADLEDADLTSADLFLTDLTQADLTNVNLEETDLTEVDLSQARVSNINFIEELEIWGCKGVEEIKKQYYVDPQKHYYERDIDRELPRYIIKKISIPL